jgi:hypothetical protein
MTGPTTVGSIDAKLTVDDSDFKRGMDEAKVQAKEVGALAPTVKVDANVGPAIAKLGEVAIAEQRVESAQRQAANSASTAYIANERLNSLREKGGVTALQLATATEAAARADRNAEAAEKKYVAAIAAANAAKSEAVKKSLEQAAANDADTSTLDKNNDAKRQNFSWMQALIATAPALVGALAPIGATAVGVAGSLTVMGAAGALAVKGISNAMQVGDSVGNTYATGLDTLTGSMNSLAGTAANAMLTSFNRAVGSINQAMPHLNSMIGEFSGLLGNIGATALKGVLDGFQAMSPLLTAAGGAIQHLVADLAGFTSSTAFQSFIAYAVAQVPRVMDLIENLGQAAFKLIGAFMPLGDVVIGILQALAAGINAIPAPVLLTLATSAMIAYGAFQMWKVIPALIGGVTAAMEFLAGPIGWVAIAVTGLVAVFGTAAASVHPATAALHDYTQALKDDSLAIGEHVQAQVAKEIVDSGAAQAAQRLGLSLQTVQQAALGNVTAIAAVKNVTDEAAKGIIDWTSGGAYASAQNKQLSSDVDLMRGSVLGASDAIKDQLDKQKLLNDMMHPTSSAMSAQALAAQDLATKYGTTVAGLQAAQDAEDKTAQSTADATVKMQLQNDAAGILKGSLDALNGKAMSAAQAQNQFDSSLANMGDHVNATGKKIHFTTTSITDMSSASVALRGQLNGQVAALQSVIEAHGGLSNSTGHAKAEMEDMRKQIINNAIAHGVDKTAVENYIDGLLRIPKKIPPTKLDIDNAAANAKLAYTKWLIDSLHNKTVFVDVQTSDSVNTGRGAAKGVGKVEVHANGGMVGTSYLASGGFPDFTPRGTDTVPAMLTPGEIVMKRASVQSIGAGTLLEANRTGKLPTQGVPGTGGVHIEHLEINEQQDPNATVMAFTRRMSMLAT